MNRRELFAALAATAVAGDALAFADTTPGSSPVMGSKVFDWNSLVDKPTATGSVRTVCNTPTATLENLEIHISTLNPGLMSHPPHKHPNEELDYCPARHGGDAVKRRVDPRGAGIGDLQRIEPAARIQERGHRAGDLSRGELQDGCDAAGKDGVCRERAVGR